MENKNITCEDLLDEKGNLICDEFYYQFYDDQDFNPIWGAGLKKVFDAKDKSGDYELEDAIEYMDDDQEKMLAIINEIIGKKIDNEVIDFIYVNYKYNEDGSENLLKQIMIVYEIGGTDHLVIRTPFYAYTEYALNEFFNSIDL